MDFIQQLHIWIKGDVLQGRWMIGIAATILFPFVLLVMKSDHLLLRGMLIPICLLLVMNAGYGAYLLVTRPGHAEQTENKFSQTPEETLKNELVKVKADSKSYMLFKLVWAGAIVVFLVVYFLCTEEYYKGLALGLVAMFFGMLLIDTFFHARLLHYLKALQNVHILSK